MGGAFGTKGELKCIHFVGTEKPLSHFGLRVNVNNNFVALKQCFGFTTKMPVRRRVAVIAGPLKDTDLQQAIGAREAKIPITGHLVVWTAPSRDKANYNIFRTAIDRILGYSSLCIPDEKLAGNQGSRLAGFAANNAMKINLRVRGNGVNYLVDLKPFLPTRVFLKDTMIIGADVTYPGGSTLCNGSIATLEGTIDRRCMVYRGASRANPPRAEVSKTLNPDTVYFAYLMNRSSISLLQCSITSWTYGALTMERLFLVIFYTSETVFPIRSVIKFELAKSIGYQAILQRSAEGHVTVTARSQQWSARNAITLVSTKKPTITTLMQVSQSIRHLELGRVETEC